MTQEELDYNWNAYFYPGTEVLKNKLNIMDATELQQKEQEITVLRNAELIDKPINGNFDELHLKNIHAYIFQDLYDFAGQYRNTNIEKNNCAFVSCEAIEWHLKNILELSKEELHQVQNKYDFATHLANLFCQIMFVHPFREGNGRSIREFIREYAIEKSKLFSFGPLNFSWQNVDTETLNKAIHFSVVFRSSIELEFFKALTPSPSIEDLPILK